jgi:hypothetical protein
MRTIKGWDSKETIRPKSIDTLRLTYLKRLNISASKQLSLAEATNLFLLVIKDFKKGMRSLDELSSFGFFLFHKAAKRYPKSDLFQASLAASELNFAIRNSYKNIPMFMKTIDAFYASH